MRKAYIQQHIHLEILLWAAISLIIACSIGIGTFYAGRSIKALKVEHADFDIERNRYIQRVMDIINESQEGVTEGELQEKLEQLEGEVYVVDPSGKVLYQKRENAYTIISSINLKKWKIKNVHEKYAMKYPIVWKEKSAFLLQKAPLVGHYTYTNDYVYVFAGVTLLSTFLILIFIGVHRKIKYIRYMSASIQEIAKGNLSYEVRVEGQDELAQVAKEINHMEEALLQKINQERKVEQDKQELITNVSHDLKTPLTIILGYLDIVRNNQVQSDEEKKKYIETCYDKAINLQKMILKLFDLVRMKNATEPIHCQDVNIVLFVKQMLAEYEMVAKEKQLLLHTSFPDHPVMIYADIDKLKTIFDNLFGNALKYSRRQGIIQCTMQVETESVLICIENPVNNDQIEVDRIFERFYRGDKARNSKIEGNGVGLSIVKEMVEMQNGTVWSEVKEQTFCIYVRLRRNKNEV